MKTLITIVMLICLIPNLFIITPSSVWEPTEWNDVNEAVNDIYDEYGVRVHFTSPELFIDGYEYELVENSERALYELDVINSVLSKYSDEGLKQIPKDFFVLDKITKDGENICGTNTDSILGDFLQLSISQRQTMGTTEDELTLDHEIFHSINPSDEFMEEYNSIPEQCRYFGEYACTSINEELSEVWSQSFHNPEGAMEKYDLIQKEFAYLLK